MKRLFFLASLCCALTASAQNDSTLLGMSELHVKYQVAQLCDYPNQWRQDDWRDTLIYELDICDKAAVSESRASSLLESSAEREQARPKVKVAHWQRDNWQGTVASGWKYFQMTKKIWPFSMNTQAQLGEVVIGLPQKGQLTRRVILDVAGLMEYSESIPQMKWKVQSEHKTVLGYDCQRATCEFRGRKWEAWFAAAIPASYGPYKFGGLPGLILDLEDSTHEWHFTAQEVGRPSTPRPMVYRHYDAEKMDHKRLMKKEKLLNLNHTAFAQDYGANIKMDGMEIGSMPYYPLEMK